MNVDGESLFSSYNYINHLKMSSY